MDTCKWKHVPLVTLQLITEGELTIKDSGLQTVPKLPPWAKMYEPISTSSGPIQILGLWGQISPEDNVIRW